MNQNGFIREYIIKLMRIQELLLNFLDDDDIQNFDTNCLDEIKIRESKYKIKVLLYLISKISQNHHRNSIFFNKIEKLLQMYKKEIMNFFTNLEVFLIFKRNKRILLSLFKEQIIIPNKEILINAENSYSFYAYFLPEFKSCFKKEKYQKIISMCPEVTKTNEFEEKRKEGENDRYVCELIRNDLIDDFIVFVNQTNLSLSSIIEPSIYETNSFLNKNESTLIEYSAFYGSIQIFRFLLLNNVDIKTKIWLFAIHGNNPEIIHILEENDIKPPSGTFVMCYFESNKCHHNDVMKYFQQNYIESSDDYKFFLSIKSDICFRTFNFYDFLENGYKINESAALYFACKHDHFLLVDFLLKNMNDEINSTTVFF